MNAEEMLAILRKDPTREFTRGGNSVLKVSDLCFWSIGTLLNSNWELLPKEVTYEEALKALDEGKTIVCENCQGNDCRCCAGSRVKQQFSKKDRCAFSICIPQILTGKWSIID